MSSPRSASDRVFLPDADQEVARRRYRELAEAIDEGVYRLDSEWHVVAVNDAFLAATGYSREDLLGEHVSLLLSRDDLDRLKREVRRQREARDPTPLTLSLRTVDGETVPLDPGMVDVEEEYRAASGEEVAVLEIDDGTVLVYP